MWTCQFAHFYLPTHYRYCHRWHVAIIMIVLLFFRVTAVFFKWIIQSSITNILSIIYHCVCNTIQIKYTYMQLYQKSAWIYLHGHLYIYVTLAVSSCMPSQIIDVSCYVLVSQQMNNLSIADLRCTGYRSFAHSYWGTIHDYGAARLFFLECAAVHTCDDIMLSFNSENNFSPFEVDVQMYVVHIS